MTSSSTPPPIINDNVWRSQINQEKVGIEQERLWVQNDMHWLVNNYKETIYIWKYQMSHHA